MTNQEFVETLDYLHILYHFDEKNRLYQLFVDDVTYYLAEGDVKDFQDDRELQTYLTQIVVKDYLAGKIGKVITVH